MVPPGDDAKGRADWTTSGMRSPTRQFVASALLTVGGSTLLFGLVLAHFVERGILEREWRSTAEFLRVTGRAHLRSEDFGATGPGPLAASPESQDRFEDFARQARMLPEVLRLVAYDGRGAPLWTDAERSPQPQGNADRVRHALGGETDVHLESGTPQGQERVELYVPLTFAGEGRVAGVLEAYVDASRVMTTVRRARLTLWALALLSGIALFTALFGIVWRASRTLRRQHAALAQRAEQLTQANAELRAVQNELVTAERFAAFGEITAAVAHGLGNPLASIRATAQLALLDAPEGPLRPSLLQIVADTDRLRERMRALLDFGRPIEQRRIPVALEAAVRHACEQIQGRCAAQGVRLDLRFPEELPKVRLDPARFEEAFLCLAGNGLDAMPAGGVLSVTAAMEGGERRPRTLCVVVADMGPGMSTTILARAFEPFFTTKLEGSGLGLAVARKLLEGSGGRLQLESDAQGTRAIVTLTETEDG